MRSIDCCKNIRQVNEVLKEQDIFVYDSLLAKCQTIKEIIEVCKKCGAK